MQQILTIDLTNQAIGQYQIPAAWQQQFLGGGSLAARLLYEYLTPELDPLAPEAPLLFLNGPLSGTSGPTVGRYVVCGKSPATGAWGESNCGGFWGVELRKAGFDGVWITGRAETPVYLWINDGTVEIRPADDLWGLDPYAVQDQLSERLDTGKIRVASIGPVGESQLPMALILADHGRAAGRTGMGAVMGSKNLKAIAVKGTQTIPLADPATYKLLRTEVNRTLHEDPASDVLRALGSAGVSDYFDYLGEMPKRGFTRGEMPGTDQITGTAVAESILTGQVACHACVIACGRVVRLAEGAAEQKGAEYETLVGFGPNLWLNDPVFATRMGDLCDRYGIDVISVSNVIAFAFTLFEMGVITEAQTGGLALQWGDAEMVEKLVHLLARREGFGAQLAEGARALGRRYAVEDRAVQVKGLEVAYHDPRGGTGMALAYATSPVGGSHNFSDYFTAEIGGIEEDFGMEMFDRHGGAEKARNVTIHQNWRTVFNALVMCIFGNVSPEDVVALVNAACGYDWTLEDVMRSGERGWNLKRAINNRLGLRREHDQLPQTLLEPLTDGGSAGVTIDVEPMLQAYYAARGWDWETGFPTKEKLQSLQLDEMAADLWPAM